MRDEQAGVAGIRFRNAGKIFYFHTGGMRLDVGEYVVVETSRGHEVGRVVISPEQVVVNELGREELKPILRLALEADIRRADLQRQKAEELLPEARRLGEELGFPARIDAAEFTLDGRRLTISFTSEERVDYRDYMHRAAERFGVKVDMRQLGARDRARLAGGYGICGRELCCSSWLATFPSISIRMAKEQELPLNPQKISGLCGRLLCCLSYEEEGYKEMRKTLPKIGQRCSTPTGEGKCIAVNILRRQVTLLVQGIRVEVPDRDLGTVVRWDTSSKSGEPPPSISRAEAIEQGLIEPVEADFAETAAAAAGWLMPAPEVDPGPGRGRLPGGGPRKEIRNKPERQPNQQPKAKGGEAKAGEPPERRRPAQGGQGARQGRRPGAPGLPQGRKFERAAPNEPPAAEPPKDAPPQPAPGEPPEQRQGRRRGRRGRGGRGANSQTPPTE